MNQCTDNISLFYQQRKIKTSLIITHQLSQKAFIQFVFVIKFQIYSQCNKKIHKMFMCCKSTCYPVRHIHTNNSG
jgi:hypothetical protein